MLDNNSSNSCCNYKLLQSELLIMTQMGLTHASSALHTRDPHLPKFIQYTPLTVMFLNRFKQIQMQFKSVQKFQAHAHFSLYKIAHKITWNAFSISSLDLSY